MTKYTFYFANSDLGKAKFVSTKFYANRIFKIIQIYMNTKKNTLLFRNGNVLHVL
jgi:hypothetical protein